MGCERKEEFNITAMLEKGKKKKGFEAFKVHRCKNQGAIVDVVGQALVWQMLLLFCHY